MFSFMGLDMASAGQARALLVNPKYRIQKP